MKSRIAALVENSTRSEGSGSDDGEDGSSSEDDATPSTSTARMVSLDSVLGNKN
jgi:hypothetical protein